MLMCCGNIETGGHDRICSLLLRLLEIASFEDHLQELCCRYPQVRHRLLSSYLGRWPLRMEQFSVNRNGDAITFNHKLRLRKTTLHILMFQIEDRFSVKMNAF